MICNGSRVVLLFFFLFKLQAKTFNISYKAIDLTQDQSPGFFFFS
jgi:hypothetical protein